jgi:hypothetical protein
MGILPGGTGNGFAREMNIPKPLRPAVEVLCTSRNIRQIDALLFGSGFLATTTGWVIGFVVGLLGAVLSYLLYFLGVALLAAAFGWAMGAGLMTALGFDPGLLTAIVGIISALVLAALVLLLNIQKYVIIAITAIGGANAMVLAGLLLLGQTTLEGLSGAGSAIAPILQDSWFWLVIWLVLAAGFIVQIIINRTYAFDRNQYQQGWG